MLEPAALNRPHSGVKQKGFIGPRSLRGRFVSAPENARTGASQHDQPRDKCPHDQSHRGTEGAVGFPEIKMGQCDYVNVLGSLPQDPGCNRGWEYAAVRNLAVWKQPIYEEEDRDACDYRDHLKHKIDH